MNSGDKQAQSANKLISISDLMKNNKNNAFLSETLDNEVKKQVSNQKVKPNPFKANRLAGGKRTSLSPTIEHEDELAEELEYTGILRKTDGKTYQKILDFVHDMR